MAWFPCNLNSNLGGKLLWTNPNPTSAFAAQTISLNLSEYNFIIVESIAGISLTSISKQTIFNKISDYTTNRYCIGYTNSDNDGIIRHIANISNSGVTFSAGYLNTSLRNDVCIPVKIYGVN